MNISAFPPFIPVWGKSSCEVARGRRQWDNWAADVLPRFVSLAHCGSLLLLLFMFSLRVSETSVSGGMRENRKVQEDKLALACSCCRTKRVTCSAQKCSSLLPAPKNRA